MLPSLKQNLKSYRHLKQGKTFEFYEALLKKYVAEEIAAHPENVGAYLDVDIEKGGYVQYSIPAQSFKDIPKIERTLKQVKRYNTLKSLLESITHSENIILLRPDFDLSLINFKSYWALTNAVQCITNLPRNPDKWRILPENIVALSMHQCFKYGNTLDYPPVPLEEWVENLWVVSRDTVRKRLMSTHRLWGTQPLIADARKAIVCGYRQRETKGGDTTPYLRLLTEISLRGGERKRVEPFFVDMDERRHLRTFIDACLSRDLQRMAETAEKIKPFVVPRFPDMIDQVVRSSAVTFANLVDNGYYWKEV